VCLTSGAQEPDTTFKVNVKLVNVFVTVTDEHGAPIASLKKDNFELQEDGKDQRISVFDKESALPLSIVLAVDTSLSTRKDLPLELASARRFAHAILRPIDALSLYQFSEIVNGSSRLLLTLAELITAWIAFVWVPLLQCMTRFTWERKHWSRGRGER